MNKIEALRKTIYNLENNVIKYNWADPNACNCGVLARTICNTDDILKVGYLKSPVTCGRYTSFANQAFCLTSTLPLPIVFQELKNAGFSFEEILSLENLSELSIVKRMKKENDIYMSTRGFLTNMNRYSEKYLISYLKAWVEILEESITPAPEFVPITYTEMKETVIQCAN